jgi:hypothetical protein
MTLPFTSTVLIYSTTGEAQSQTFPPKFRQEKREKPLFVKFCNNIHDLIPSSKFHTFPHSDYATFGKFPPKQISFLPKYKKTNTPNNLKYIKLNQGCENNFEASFSNFVKTFIIS